MIKVVLIVLFIIVGLIYDWGGVIGHPGPVSTHILQLSCAYIELSYLTAGPVQLPQWPSFHRRLQRIRSDVRLCVLLVWRCRACFARSWRVDSSSRHHPSCGQGDLFPYHHFLYPNDAHHRTLHQLAGSYSAQFRIRYVSSPSILLSLVAYTINRF